LNRQNSDLHFRQSCFVCPKQSAVSTESCNSRFLAALGMTRKNIASDFLKLKTYN
jgi:hypothetical protein